MYRPKNVFFKFIVNTIFLNREFYKEEEKNKYLNLFNTVCQNI